MESNRKELSAVSSTKSSKLLRYPLRSASRSKDATNGVADLSNSSSRSCRGRIDSSMSKSVSVLEISGTGKSCKPPSWLSNHAHSSVSPIPRPASGITPISSNRLRGTPNTRSKNDTPKCDLLKSVTSRHKYSAICSASYWISQIKLSESAAKHSVSLGFFKLALESGCEPLQRLRDELKSYVRRYNLFLELEIPTKEVLKCYNIAENSAEVQVSETCSHISQFSDDQNSPVSLVGKLKPKPLNSDNIRASAVEKKVKSGSIPKNVPASRNSSNMNARLHRRNNMHNKSKSSHGVVAQTHEAEEENIVGSTVAEDGTQTLQLDDDEHEEKENMVVEAEASLAAET